MMRKNTLFNDGIDKILAYKRGQSKLFGWFLYQELKMMVREELKNNDQDPDNPTSQGLILQECVKRMPLSIPEGSVIAGTQDDAFSPSYALINSAFKVESFAGYCDPLAVYDDIQPTNSEETRPEHQNITLERIETVRDYFASTRYVKNLQDIYKKTGAATEEVVFFVEPVTGHIIPDMRPILAKGIIRVAESASNSTPYGATMRQSLEAALILAARYADLAEKLVIERQNDHQEVERLRLISENCRLVPEQGATNLHQALQTMALLWQVMCLEQAPNPYAFSIGNLDRILQPYLRETTFEEAVALVRHFLAFLMVGDRCWAISQNVMIGGRDVSGEDLHCPMTDVVLEAFYRSNTPQPALSVKLYANTSDKLYQSLGRFFFTPGHSTPSLFNDDMVFTLLESNGIEKQDLPDYAIAGCQEPLIMGKDNGNTTNSWLNLAKVLEITLHDGVSALSGIKLGLSYNELGYATSDEMLRDLPNAFQKQLDFVLAKMVDAANSCVTNLGTQAAPFTSSMMGCLGAGRDLRDTTNPGVKYFKSGCLIHGLSVVADSFVAAKAFLDHEIGTTQDFLQALKNNFEDNVTLHEFLKAQDKFGNDLDEVDGIAAELAETVSTKIKALKNPAGSPFQPDFSTPSTHLLYGYHVGATPDGRESRAMLGYGIDPRPGCACGGIEKRMLSQGKLPYLTFSGGYASHLGLSSDDFSVYRDEEEKMLTMKDQIIKPLFRFEENIDSKNSPFYVYFNIDSATHLKQVLEAPEIHAPSGVYIMRIHGTFVNFLDLSPAIQQDIIERLDPASTKSDVPDLERGE